MELRQHLQKVGLRVLQVDRRAVLASGPLQPVILALKGFFLLVDPGPIGQLVEALPDVVLSLQEVPDVLHLENGLPALHVER